MREQACQPVYNSSSFVRVCTRQVNENRVEEGMELLVKALDCKWVAVEAAKVLQQVRCCPQADLRSLLVGCV